MRGSVGTRGVKWTFIKGAIADAPLLDDVFETYHPTVLVNLRCRRGTFRSLMRIRLRWSVILDSSLARAYAMAYGNLRNGIMIFM